jgi:soluble lytic murein transglycosylase-like protein
MHTATRHAAERPPVSSRQIGDRLRARPTAIATAIIAMMGMAGTTPFALSAFAQGNAASAARVSDPFAAFVAEASQRFGIPVSWIRAVMHAESGEDIHALSPKGAMGLMQLMPATWASLRARHSLGANPYDPHDNILAGAAFCESCTIATDLPVFSPHTTPARDDMRTIWRQADRFLTKREPMSSRSHR